MFCSELSGRQQYIANKMRHKNVQLLNNLARISRLVAMSHKHSKTTSITHQ